MAKLRTFFLFDENGAYAGPVEAENCPENATEVKPTQVGDFNVHNVWNGKKWTLTKHEDILKATEARNKRNALLSASDFTQVMDFQGDADAWAKYRQDLRELTAQEKFPSEITWPEKPSLKALDKAKK